MCDCTNGFFFLTPTLPPSEPDRRTDRTNHATSVADLVQKYVIELVHVCVLKELVASGYYCCYCAWWHSRCLHDIAQW